MTTRECSMNRITIKISNRRIQVTRARTCSARVNQTRGTRYLNATQRDKKGGTLTKVLTSSNSKCSTNICIRVPIKKSFTKGRK